MKEDNKIVNAIWIRGELRPNNLMTIKSFQEFGHEFIIYSYIDLPNAGCEVRNARNYYPEQDLVFYKNLDFWFQLGGCERMKAKLMYDLGGWWVDLDVTCLKPFDFEEEHIFRHDAAVNIIKVPKNSPFSKYYYDNTSHINENTTQYGFGGLGRFFEENPEYKQFMKGEDIFGVDNETEDGINLKYFTKGFEPLKEQYCIHWMDSIKLAGNTKYEEGSFYDLSLKKYGH